MPKVKSSNMEIKTKKKNNPNINWKGYNDFRKKSSELENPLLFSIIICGTQEKKKLRPENIVELQRNAHAKQIQLILRVKV